VESKHGKSGNLHDRIGLCLAIFLSFRNTSLLNEGHFANFAQKWLPRQRSLRNWEKNPDRSSTDKHLLFGAKIVKIGPAHPEVICFRAIIKKEKKINTSKI